MALSEQDVLAGLAELVNDETGIAQMQFRWRSPSPMIWTSTQSR